MQVIIIDFSCGKLLEFAEGRLWSPVGLNKARPPEVVDFKIDYGKKINLYYLGTILYNLVTGTYPFSDYKLTMR